MSSNDAKTGRARGLTTRILHADRLGGVEHGALHKPMHTAVAFGYERAADLVAVFQGERAGHVYGRQGNPTTHALEAKISLMEQCRGSVSFATGMGALSALFCSLLRAGDHLIASRYLFGNTASLLQTLAHLGVEVSLVDGTDAAHVASVATSATRMVLVETIANPRTQVADLAGIGTLCRARGWVYVVDNTLTTPVLFVPREVGASLVMNSLSKEICGHGDALGGAISDTGLFDWSAYPNIAPSYRKGDPANWGLQQVRKKGLRDMGATLASEQAHRIATGAETLALRMERACRNALELARWLEQQRGVEKVHYPGLASHAEHARATQLFKAYGSLLSFELAPGRDPLAFLDALGLVIKSSHLGDARTLAIPVAQTIFWEMGPDRRRDMGIADGLIRLSVGIEEVEDLREDLAQGLEGATSR